MKKRLWFSYFCVLFCWGALTYFTIGIYLGEGTLFAQVRDGHPYISDFVDVYNAGELAKRCLSGPVDIYDIEVQNSSMEQIIAPVKPELPFYLQYPPHFFVFAYLLSFFSLPVAWGLWCTIAFLLSFLTLYLIGIGNLESSFSKCFLTVAFLMSFPTWVSFRLGQPSLLILPAVAMFFYFLQQNKFARAGIVTVIVAFKLQYLPVIFAVGAIFGRWRYVCSTVVASIIVLAISTLVLRVENILSYPNALLRGETGSAVSGVAVQEMQNLRGTLALFNLPEQSVINAITSIAMILSFAFIVWLWWKVYPRLKSIGEDSFYILASQTILIALAFSLHTHSQDYILALMPCFWLWRWTDKFANQKSRTVFVLRVLIISFPVLSWVFFILSALFHSLFMQPYFLWALIVFALSMKLVKVRSAGSAKMY